MANERIIVSSWNEWDQLKHVIVGVAEKSNIPPMEPALEPKLSEDSGMKGSHGPRTEESVEKAKSQLDNFIKILNSLSIKVDRPTPIDFSKSIATPDWVNDGMFGCMPPRDVILTVGNEMLEAPMSYRCRWFEYLAYRPLLEQYYKDDPNMRWEAAPKPRLTSKTYKPNYLPKGISDEERYKKIEGRDFILNEDEPLFDAAEILRFGKDLFFHNNFTSNLKGLNWLRRHFPNHRIHQINLPGDLIPTHIDACFTPIKPGVMIINPNRKISSEQRKIFDDNKLISPCALLKSQYFLTGFVSDNLPFFESPSRAVIFKTDDNLPPYSAGNPPARNSISEIMSALNVEKTPPMW